ncbi:heparinase [Pseudoflavitalea sp. G-6-1-2]|uniref:heparinase II/III domain-containing protein n=1 Tax=Pseudoflavitalea sp. G-6-1-2 TaxID=2728841 RepID=UPI00146B1455|nr:heparinase II/III family protein [Pseudoflavitalea sp. G-6-1-2]NML23898.1 heparinase [Pseudoflavitalea sp. G-6-1-2]
MQKAITTLTLLLLTITCFTQEPRNLLQQKATHAQLDAWLLPRNKWITYPAYADRAGWDQLTGSVRNKLISDGEANLKYKWQPVLATEYLAFERDGNRMIQETPRNANIHALLQLTLAELAEGKGRFLDQIINGVWQTCEMTGWANSAHLIAQSTKRALPDHREQLIDLASGDIGSLLSWIHYFFKDTFDKIDPVIAAKIRSNVETRILNPYLERNDYWWQALNNQNGIVNNWNAWCNSNVLACFLLMENDTAKLHAGVYKTMRSIDQFMNYVKSDGACEEGPGYWTHAAGKLFDYLEMINRATGGKINLLDNPMIKRMGEYIAYSYVGNGWMVNFADAPARGNGEPGLIYRYGKAVQSFDMTGFAATLLAERNGNNDLSVSRNFYRTMENISIDAALKATQPALVSAPFTWYPQTQFCYMRNNSGYFLAAKAGFNNESHNHNDVGTFSLYIDTLPVFIDVGVGTYTKRTFSSDRYSIWSMQSNYHNLPMINGEAEHFGAEYKATDVQFDAQKRSFSLDMAPAFVKEAEAKVWKRAYTLSDKGLLITDKFELNKTVAPNTIHFITWKQPVIAGKGIIEIPNGPAMVQLTYSGDAFDATIEPIEQTDQRLKSIWGQYLYRIVLKARKLQQQGQYKFVISKR